MAGADNVIKQLFEKAEELQAEREAIRDERVANRNALRTMRDAGVLTDAQSKQVDELYPPRGSGNSDDAEEEE